jgi:lactoylglutathione lyase
MQAQSVYQSVHPIGETNPNDLPVGDLETAVPFYVEKLGFTVESRSAEPHKAAVIARDGVRMRLAENGGDPGQASCYIGVSDVDQARAELGGKGLDMSEIRVDQHGGKTYRVFFVRAPDGLCYCLGQQVE